MSEKILLDKVSRLLVSAKISMNTVEDYIEFYRTGNLPEPFDIPPGTNLPFNIKPVETKPKTNHLDIIREKTDDITIKLDDIID